MYNNLYDFVNEFSNENNEQFNKQPNKKALILKIIIGVIIYLTFLLTGILATTYYHNTPQIVTPDLRTKRIVYNKLIKVLDDTKECQFAGIQELNYIEKNNLTDWKLIQLKKQIDLLNEKIQYVNELQYKNYTESELFVLVLDYLTAKRNLLQMCSDYYSTALSVTKSEKSKNQQLLLNQYSLFKRKEKSILSRIRAIKEYELLYERRDFIDEFFQSVH